MDMRFTNKWIFFTLLMTGPILLFSQIPLYDMNLQLDTVKNTLSVDIKLDISTIESLPKDTIWFHLPFNSYNKYSPFAAEQLKAESPYFHFRRESEYCSMSGLFIQKNNINQAYFFKDEGQEFVGILAEKAEIINFSYTIQLPKLIDGLGYSNGNYFLHNFYPQLLPYDGQWHFSPNKQYIHPTYRSADIGARINDIKSEIFTVGIPRCIGNELMIDAYNVKDFAIVMIKNSKYIQRSIFPSNNNKVPLSMVFLDNYDEKKWPITKDDVQFIIDKFTKIFGTYPHPTINVYFNNKSCESCFLASGMRQILAEQGDRLDLMVFLVGILSEVWAEGIMDVKPEEYWMFNGLSSYYSTRINYEIIPDSLKDNTTEFKIPENSVLYEELKKGKLTPLKTSVDQLDARQQYVNTNYKSNAFYQYIETLVGQETLDKAVHSFLENHQKFTYTSFVKKLEDISNKSLRTSLDTYINAVGNTDYAIKEVERKNNTFKINMLNNDSISLPINISFVKRDGSSESIVIPGFIGEKSIVIEVKDIDNIYVITLDKEGVLPEKDRNNNHFFPNGSKKSRPFRLKSIFAEENSKYKKLLMQLYPAYNNLDGWMAGSVFTNSNFNIFNDFSFAVAPMYSFRNKELYGQAWANYNHHLGSETFDLLTLRCGIKTFSRDYDKKFDYTERYIRIDPTIKLRFKNKLVNGITASLWYKMTLLDEELGDDSDGHVKISHINSMIHRLGYDYKKYSELSTSGLNFIAEQQSFDGGNYLKLTAMATQRWMYRPNKNFYFRVFTSGFLTNTNKDVLGRTLGSIALIYDGVSDYTYDEYFFSRQNQNLLYDDQVSLVNGGGFKTPVGSQFSIGTSNNFAAALNTSIDLPFRQSWFPIRAYFDIGTASVKEGDKFVNRWMYNGGLSLNFDDIFAIHCPLIYSKDLGNIYKEVHKSFFSRLSFSVNLNRVNLWEEEDPDLD